MVGDSLSENSGDSKSETSDDSQLPFINGINNPRIPLIESPLIQNNFGHRPNERAGNFMDNDMNEQNGACDSNKSESQSSSSNDSPSYSTIPRVNSVHIDIHKNPNYNQTNNESKTGLFLFKLRLGMILINPIAINIKTTLIFFFKVPTSVAHW